MRSGIYQIVNHKTGHRYIGSAVNLGRRMNYHRWLLEGNRHWNRRLQLAWIKYRAPAFEFTVLCVCRKDDLLFFEQRAIDQFAASLYNTKKLAHSMLGYRHTDAARQKMSAAKLGTKQSPETRSIRSAALKGHTVPDSVRAALSKRRRGAKATDEQRRKMSIAAKARIARTGKDELAKVMDRMREARGR